MNLYLRLLWLWLTAGGPLSEPRLAPSRLNMRAWLNDIDLFGHVNNGRYLTLMDLGRLHLVMCSGLLPVMRERGWHAAAAAVEIRFKRPLKLGQRFTLVTELVDWDAAWFVFEQRFEAGGKVCARALVQAQFRLRRGRVPTAEALAAIGADTLHPPAHGRLVGRIAEAVEIEN